ncbi:MAG: hypothetical protein PF441_00375, partial [Desulfuromusa sp.]|nr:hypothetical protein [Desulfuromusa sp.]
MLPNFEFAIICFSKVQNKDFKLDKSGEGWRNVKKFLKIDYSAASEPSLRRFDWPLANRNFLGTVMTRGQA